MCIPIHEFKFRMNKTDTLKLDHVPTLPVVLSSWIRYSENHKWWIKNETMEINFILHFHPCQHFRTEVPWVCVGEGRKPNLGGNNSANIHGVVHCWKRIHHHNWPNFECTKILFILRSCIIGAKKFLSKIGSNAP